MSITMEFLARDKNTVRFKQKKNKINMVLERKPEDSALALALSVTDIKQYQ